MVDNPHLALEGDHRQRRFLCSHPSWITGAGVAIPHTFAPPPPRQALQYSARFRHPSAKRLANTLVGRDMPPRRAQRINRGTSAPALAWLQIAPSPLCQAATPTWLGGGRVLPSTVGAQRTNSTQTTDSTYLATASLALASQTAASAPDTLSELGSHGMQQQGGKAAMNLPAGPQRQNVCAKQSLPPLGSLSRHKSIAWGAIEQQGLAVLLCLLARSRPRPCRRGPGQKQTDQRAPPHHRLIPHSGDWEGPRTDSKGPKKKGQKKRGPPPSAGKKSSGGPPPPPPKPKIKKKKKKKKKH